MCSFEMRNLPNEPLKLSALSIDRAVARKKTYDWGNVHGRLMTEAICPWLSFITTINNKSEINYRGKCLGWPVTSYGSGRPTQMHQSKNSRHLTDCQRTVYEDVDGVSIECQLSCWWSVGRVSIESLSSVDRSLSPRLGDKLLVLIILTTTATTTTRFIWTAKLT